MELKFTKMWTLFLYIHFTYHNFIQYVLIGALVPKLDLLRHNSVASCYDVFNMTNHFSIIVNNRVLLYSTAVRCSNEIHYKFDDVIVCYISHTLSNIPW